MQDKPISDRRGSKDEQACLWHWGNDKPIPGFATARTYIGDFFEEATKELLGVKRLKTQAYKICPDLKARTDSYFECKSVGKSNGSLIYDHRADAYRDFISQGNVLHYIFWHHTMRLYGGTTLARLRFRLAAAVTKVVIVPAGEVFRALENAPARFTNYSRRNGEGQWKMRPARRVTAEALRGWATGIAEISSVKNVYGFEIPIIPVFGREKL